MTTLMTSENRQLLESQIQPGLILNPITEEYYRLFKGKDQTQVDQETGQLIGVNGFEIVTQFFQNVLWAQYPHTSASTRLLQALETSTEYRSINGYGVVVVQGNSYRAIDSRYYWALVNNVGELIGSVVAYPYSSTNQDALPDRVKVCISQDETDTIQVREYHYSGVTIGQNISVDNVQGDIIAWGDGKSDYTSLKWLMQELNNRLNKNRTLLDRHSNPHLMGPPNALAPKTSQGGQTGNESDNAQFNYDEQGMFLPTDGEQEYKYLVWNANAELNKFQLNRILDLIHMQTGIPATAFGISSQTTGDSGLSLERQMFAALAKVSRWQRDIETAVESLGVTDLQWNPDLLGTFASRVQQNIQLVQSDIISRDEARADLGYAGNAPERRNDNAPTTQNMDGTS